MSEVSEAEEVLRAVDQIVAEAGEPVYVAVRLMWTNDPEVIGVAFMGTFTTKEVAFERCAENVKQASLNWNLRGERTDQWETAWLANNVKFLVAEQEVRDA